MRIANIPFHALSMQEKETFKERCELMSTMGDLLRQTARQREQETLEREQCISLFFFKFNLFNFYIPVIIFLFFEEANVDFWCCIYLTGSSETETEGFSSSIIHSYQPHLPEQYR